MNPGRKTGRGSELVAAILGLLGTAILGIWAFNAVRPLDLMQILVGG